MMLAEFVESVLEEAAHVVQRQEPAALESAGKRLAKLVSDHLAKIAAAKEAARYGPKNLKQRGGTAAEV